MGVSRGRKAAGALIAAGATTSAVALDVPMAAAAASDCVSGHICVWDDSSFQGGRSDIQGVERDAEWALVGGVNAARADDVESHYNHSSKTWAIYFEHHDFGGRELCTKAESSSGNLGNFNLGAWNFNDRVTGHILTTQSNPNTVAEVEDDGCWFTDED